jgi:hypothetical protein
VSTNFSWSENRSIRFNSRVFCEGEIIAEKIQYQHPVTMNGGYSFINRSAMCAPTIQTITGVNANSQGNKRFAFLVQITDTRSQQHLFALAVILKCGTTGPIIAYHFPKSEAPNPVVYTM